MAAASRGRLQAPVGCEDQKHCRRTAKTPTPPSLEPQVGSPSEEPGWISRGKSPTGHAPPRRCGGPPRRLWIYPCRRCRARRRRKPAPKARSRGCCRVRPVGGCRPGPHRAITSSPLSHELPPAPVRPNPGCGGDKQLGGRVRRDHRPDVAPVEHRAPSPCGEALLERKQGRAHLRHRCNPAGQLARAAGAQARVVEDTGPLKRRCGLFSRREKVAALASQAQSQDSDAAVEQACVEVWQLVESGQMAGCGSLAGRRGPVHCDDKLHYSLLGLASLMVQATFFAQGWLTGFGE